MMLFFTILSVLVAINVSLLIFSVNKSSETKIKKDIILNVKDNMPELDTLPKDTETNIVYKKAI